MLESYIEFEKKRPLRNCSKMSDAELHRAFDEVMGVIDRNERRWFELFRNPDFICAESAKNDSENVIHIYTRSCRGDDLIQYSSFIKLSSGNLDAIRHVNIDIRDYEEFQKSIDHQCCLVDAVFAHYLTLSDVEKEKKF